MGVVGGKSSVRSKRTISLSATGVVPVLVTRDRQTSPFQSRDNCTIDTSASLTATRKPRTARVSSAWACAVGRCANARGIGTATAVPSSSRRVSLMRGEPSSLTIVFLAERAQPRGGVLGCQVALHGAEQLEPDHELLHRRRAQQRR